MPIDAQTWENFYLLTDPQVLPWNAGRADKELVSRVRSGVIPRGQALEVGVGLGHDAVFLLENAFDVIGIDISPSAIRLARENASHHGFFGFFQVGDVRRLPIEDGYVDFAHDRGCFHTLGPDDQKKALQEIHRVLGKRGLFLLQTHSDPGNGRYAMQRARIESLTQPFFQTIETWDGMLEGQVATPSYGYLFKKK